MNTREINDTKLYSFDEVVDKIIGPVGTPRRDKIEADVAQAVNAYNIGEAIKKARLEQNLTQDELGEKIGVKKAQICKLEKACDVRLSTIGRVFKALGIPTATLDLGVGGRVALW